MNKKISASIKYMGNDQDWMIINGQRIQVADYRYTNDGHKRRDGLDAPLGYMKRIVTPWGETEMCMITAMPALNGTLDFYATVNKPKTNLGVRFSVFRVDNPENVL